MRHRKGTTPYSSVAVIPTTVKTTSHGGSTWWRLIARRREQFDKNSRQIGIDKCQREIELSTLDRIGDTWPCSGELGQREE
jgi:hypothetical protein